MAQKTTRKTLKKPRIFRIKRKFRTEFKRQIRLAIIAAIGFTVAFSWRNAVYNSSQQIVNNLIKNYSSSLSELYTAVFITIIGVIIILVTSKILKER